MVSSASVYGRSKGVREIRKENEKELLWESRASIPDFDFDFNRLNVGSLGLCSLFVSLTVSVH